MSDTAAPQDTGPQNTGREDTGPKDTAPEVPTKVPPRRRWGRFSLRTLLIVGPLLALAAGLGFRWYYPQYLEQQAVAAITEHGGTVVRQDGTGEVTSVELAGKGIDDGKLRELVPHFKNLPQLRELFLASNTIGDEGLLLLAELPGLRTVHLADTKVTDAGVVQLQAERPKLTIDRTSPHFKAARIARRPIFEHALLHLAVAPGGTEILAGAGDGFLRVFDLERREMSRSVRAHEDWTFTVVFHPSEPLVATGGGDNLIKLWSWPEMVEVGRFRGHTDDVHAIAFTPDGRRLASAGDDQVVRIWDVETRQELHSLTGHLGTIPGLAISPDGRRIASASRDDTVRLWSIDGAFLAELAGHTGDVMSVAFHPGGCELATASYDHSVRLWSLPAEGEPQEIGRLSGHTDWAFSIAYSRDGSELLSTGGDGAIMFDRQSGRPLWQAREAANLSHAVWLAGEGFALASADGGVRLGVANSGKFAHTLWTRFTPDFTSRVSLTAE
jgi:WD40 repeat protein